MEQMKAAVDSRAREYAGVATAVSHALADDPELGFAEHRAAKRLCRVLAEYGYSVSEGTAGLSTAFTATAGSGSLVVGICAEYDALPDIGHACGHNVISGAAVLTAIALRPFLDELDVTLRVFGTPAEEGGGGKITMLDAGAFDELNAVLMVHPGPHDVLVPLILSMVILEVEFVGFTPPSMRPELGRSAGDAVTALQLAIGLMRQHLRMTDRLSGYIVSEGSSPNVLPARAVLRYCVRGADNDDLADVEQRYRDCVAGAALLSGTEAKVSQPYPRYDALRHDMGLGELYRANALALGRDFPDRERDNLMRSASTDFGNVSQHVPAIHPMIGIDSGEFSNHQAEFAHFCKGEPGDRAVFDGGLAMAWTVVDAALDTQVRTSLLEGKSSREKSTE